MFQKGKFLVQDSSPIGELYWIELRECFEGDCWFVKFPFEPEPMIMTEDEILKEFTFVK